MQEESTLEQLKRARNIEDLINIKIKDPKDNSQEKYGGNCGFGIIIYRSWFIKGKEYFNGRRNCSIT